MAITAAQTRRAKTGTAVTTLSIASGDGWATPTTGNLLVVTTNLDVTMTTPSGWTAGPSVVNDNAGYLFYKISAGTESTITNTFASTNVVMTACEYAGATATPFDVQNTSAAGAGGVLGTTTTSTSVTTTAAGDLVIAVGALYRFAFGTTGGPAPTGVSWTNSFANQLDADVAPSTTRHAHTFYAELTAGAAGAYATAASWTNQMHARQELVIAFKAAAVAATTIQPRRTRNHPSFRR